MLQSDLQHFYVNKTWHYKIKDISFSIQRLDIYWVKVYIKNKLMSKNDQKGE